MADWFQKLKEQVGVDGSPDPTQIKQEIYPSAPVDDGGFTRNILMSGIPGIETDSPSFSGRNGTAWSEGQAVSPIDLPPSPISPDWQSIAPTQVGRSTISDVPSPTPQPRKVQPRTTTQKPNNEPVSLVDKETTEEPSAWQKLLDGYNQKSEDKDLDKVLADRRARQNALLWTDAATQLGSGFAGTKYDPDTLKKAFDLSGQDVEDFFTKKKSARETKADQRAEIDFAKSNERFAMEMEKAKQQMSDEKAKSSPTSEISNVTKDSIATMLDKVGRTDQAKKIRDSKLSAKQLEDVYGQMNIQNYISMYEAQQNRLAVEKERASSKKEAKDEKTKQDNANKLDKYISTTREKVTKEADAVQKGHQELTMLESAIKNPSAVKDTAALYSMVKSFDPESVVREGEVALAMQGTGAWDRANILFSKLKNGDTRVLTNQYLKQIEEYARQVQQIRDKNYRKNMDSRLGFAKDRLGLREGEEFYIDPLFENKATVPQEVERRLPDGRIALFDPNTKQFIRYK